nr:cartilage matrix protein isoform X2 [Symphalangus syndactylus]
MGHHIPPGISELPARGRRRRWKSPSATSRSQRKRVSSLASQVLFPRVPPGCATPAVPPPLRPQPPLLDSPVGFPEPGVTPPRVPQVVIVVTDGRPQDSVQDVSARARASGVELFAIGVGRVDKATLRQIASEPQDEHVDYVESYSVIEKLSRKFQEAFCVVSDLCATGDHDCEQVCISSPGSYTCACHEGFTLNSDGKTCNVCSGGGGSSATDLVFLIDGSKSVRPENFELVKKFINQIVDTLDVSDKLAQVGLVQYSSSVRQEFPLGRFHTKKDIKAAVRNMSYMEKGTMTGAALKYLIDNSFTVSSGARPGAQKVGIVFTDGRSQDYINDAAKKAKDLGFKMFAVGVGNAVEDELREIASEPVAEHYFYTADFKTINQIGKKLQKKICVALCGVCRSHPEISATSPRPLLDQCRSGISISVLSEGELW